MNLPPAVWDALNVLLDQPTLAHARELENALRASNVSRQVFGRVNQKSSIEAASGSDRGVTERLANALDASLTAARLASGIPTSDRTLTPRNAAHRFFCHNLQDCAWAPSDRRLWDIKPPVIEFWPERDEAQRFRKHRPADGLVTVLVSDSGTGIERAAMPKSILTLNSETKLKEFEAIGQFGHGGSSALAFCESCLIITQPRGGAKDEFHWTMIVPEQEPEDSKQQLIRRWFAADDGLPFTGQLADFPTLQDKVPGTAIWHFGYNRGGWIKRIAGSDQGNPWGRLGRLFFSYPLPFEIRGEFARTDSTGSRRTIKGAYYRINDLKEEDILFRSGEKEETLLVAGERYGQFSVRVFVFKESSSVRNYVDGGHPVLLTLNGQNHGELTRTVITNAGLPEISAKAVVEVRLDRLEQEALNEVISNSREQPKNSDFTRALRDILESVLRNDSDLQQIERRLEEEKARQSSADLSRKMSEFLSRILSDAKGGPDIRGAGEQEGEEGEGQEPVVRPPIPAADPPTLLEFFAKGPVYVSEGGRLQVRLRSNARPPKYSFHGDNPRCFARFEPTQPAGSRVQVVGHGDFSQNGYGSVSLACAEPIEAPLGEKVPAGTLVATIQSADGRTLETRVEVGIKPKPVARERAPRQEVRIEILFCAPEGEDGVALGSLMAEPKVAGFGSGLKKYGEALEVPPAQCTYWGAKSAPDGISRLSVEINVGNEQLQALIREGKDMAERIAAKERYVRDVVLDCYQHAFVVSGTPARVLSLLEEDPEERRRAADIHFNHDKAVRVARHEMHAARKG